MRIRIVSVEWVCSVMASAMASISAAVEEGTPSCSRDEDDRGPITAVLLLVGVWLASV